MPKVDTEPKNRRITVYFQSLAEMTLARDKAERWNRKQDERRTQPMSAYVRALIRKDA